MEWRITPYELRLIQDLETRIGPDDDFWAVKVLYDPRLPATRDEAWVAGLREILGDERIDAGLQYVRETGEPVRLVIQKPSY